MQFIRRLAMERGIIILTDSDHSGFQIRNYIAKGLPPQQVKHLYIPDVYDKELPTHTDAFNEVKHILCESEHKVIDSMKEIDAVGTASCRAAIFTPTVCWWMTR